MKKFIVCLLTVLLTLLSTVTVFAEEEVTATEIVLKENTVDYSYTTAPKYADSAKTLIVEDGVTSIGDYTFFKDTSLETVQLADTVTTIGDYAFYGCTNLKSIDLSNVISIGKYAFYGCSSLTEITFNGESGAHALDFEGDNQLSYNMNLARVNAMYDYLNEVYLTTNLGYEIDYCSPADIEELQALADYITQGCETETDKANAIYDWVKNNISYGYINGQAPSSPIDVFRYKTAVCSGYSQLMSTLFKLSGIRTAIVRCKKENTTANMPELGIYVSLAFTYKWSKYHEFSMTYVDGEWKQYDALYDFKGIDDRETITTYQWILHIDGVYAYSDEGFDLTSYGHRTADLYYYDGAYHTLDVQHKWLTGGSTLSVGACLVYNRWMYWGIEDYYYNYQGDTSDLTVGLAYHEGWYKAQVVPSDMYYINSNGVQFRSGIKNYNNETYLFNQGKSITINDSYLDIGFINGDVSMYLGESLDLSAANATITSASDNLSFECNTITAIGTGAAEVELTLNRNSRNTVTINFMIYGDIITSNDLFQSLCKHNTIHKVNDITYCDYCGKEIIEEEIIEEQPTIEVEDVQVQEEQVIEDEVVVEDTSNEDMSEAPIISEEQVEETPVAEVVEQEEVSAIEEQTEEIKQEEVQVVQEEQIVEQEPAEEPETKEMVNEVKTPIVFSFTAVPMSVEEDAVFEQSSQEAEQPAPSIVYTDNYVAEDKTAETKTTNIQANTTQVEEQEVNNTISPFAVVFSAIANFFKSLFNWLF